MRSLRYLENETAGFQFCRNLFFSMFWRTKSATCWTVLRRVSDERSSEFLHLREFTAQPSKSHLRYSPVGRARQSNPGQKNSCSAPRSVTERAAKRRKYPA